MSLIVQELHPAWEYMLFDDASLNTFVSDAYPELVHIWNHIPAPLRVQRYDLFRLLAVNYYGGFYFDTDVELRRPLDPLLNETAVFPHEEYIHTAICRQHQAYGRWSGVDCSRWFQQIGQYAFGAERHHPFVRALLDGLVRELRNPTPYR